MIQDNQGSVKNKFSDNSCWTVFLCICKNKKIHFQNMMMLQFKAKDFYNGFQFYKNIYLCNDARNSYYFASTNKIIYLSLWIVSNKTNKSNCFIWRSPVSQQTVLMKHTFCLIWRMKSSWSWWDYKLICWECKFKSLHQYLKGHRKLFQITVEAE